MSGTKLTLAAVRSLIQEHTKSLVDEIISLKAEVASLRASLDAVQRPQDHQDQPLETTASKQTFSNVVKASVQSALRDECVKKDVVMNLPENKRDIDDVNDLCHKTQVAVKPSSITRIGKPGKDRPRPLKASFPTPFDARAFMAKLEAYKRDADIGDTLKKVRCRPCRTQDEQVRFSALAKEVHQLNEAVKSRGNAPTESYSLRHNGDIWKFVKRDDGWKREQDWVFVPSSSSENKAR